MRFLLDNNLPPALAEALNSLSKADGDEVVHLRTRFAANTPDERWIAELAAQGHWVIVSHDRFAKSALERRALQASGFMVFVLTRGGASFVSGTKRSCWYGGGRVFWSKRVSSKVGDSLSHRSMGRKDASILYHQGPRQS